MLVTHAAATLRMKVKSASPSLFPSSLWGVPLWRTFLPDSSGGNPGPVMNRSQSISVPRSMRRTALKQDGSRFAYNYVRRGYFALVSIGAGTGDAVHPPERRPVHGVCGT
jgi:hypothetical protein